MLKKTISFSIIMLIVFLIYQYGVNLLKKSHSISYTVGEGSYYHINEDYNNTKDKSYYLFRVTTNDKKEFIFEFPNKFNKQKKIVSEVKEFDKDGWDCLSLVFINKKESTIPICMNNGTLYSYNYAKNYVDLSEYVSDLPGIELDKKIDKEEERNENNDNIVVVNKGYFDDEVILVYNYKRIVAYYKKQDKVVNFSNQDAYTNNLGALVGNFYLVPRYGVDSPEIRTYIKYNLNTQIKKEIVLPTPLSKDLSYANGVYDNKLYVFDKSNMTQYEINPYTDEVNVTGTVEKYPFAYINGQETNISAFEMKDFNIKFYDKIDSFSYMDYDSIYTNSEYAIIGKDGNYYKVYNKYNNTPILLFTNPNAKEIKEKNGNIYYIENDTIYKYNDYGIFEMIISNELIYNNVNVYEIY